MRPDVINHAAAPERQHGVENIKAVLGFSLGAQPDQRWGEQHLVADGDLVVVYGRREGTWQAPGFRGVPTPASGKIVEHWAVRDDLGMLQQLGALG